MLDTTRQVGHPSATGDPGPGAIGAKAYSNDAMFTRSTVRTNTPAARGIRVRLSIEASPDAYERPARASHCIARRTAKISVWRGRNESGTSSRMDTMPKLLIIQAASYRARDDR